MKGMGVLPILKKQLLRRFMMAEKKTEGSKQHSSLPFKSVNTRDFVTSARKRTHTEPTLLQGDDP
jgi:hypothetical protein